MRNPKPSRPGALISSFVDGGVELAVLVAHTPHPRENTIALFYDGYLLGVHRSQFGDAVWKPPRGATYTPLW